MKKKTTKIIWKFTYQKQWKTAKGKKNKGRKNSNNGDIKNVMQDLVEFLSLVTKWHPNKNQINFCRRWR